MPAAARKEMYLYDLAIDKGRRREGIATALLIELKSIALKNGIKTIFVEAEAKDAGAVKFYRSLGAERS